VDERCELEGIVTDKSTFRGCFLGLGRCDVEGEIAISNFLFSSPPNLPSTHPSNKNSENFENEKEEEEEEGNDQTISEDENEMVTSSLINLEEGEDKEDHLKNQLINILTLLSHISHLSIPISDFFSSASRLSLFSQFQERIDIRSFEFS